MDEEPLSPQPGLSTGGRHRFPLRVYYEDTDFSGFVYHASYLRFFERGRSELLRSLGFQQKVLHADPSAQLAFVVRRIAVDYRSPAMMDDALTVETSLADLRAASLEMVQTLWRSSELLAECRVGIACLLGGRPGRLPADLKRAFADFGAAP